MRLGLHRYSHQALRLLATLVTVVLLLVLASLGPRDRAEPVYRQYVALGDSYTAAPFVPLTDVARGCFRSSNNYPRLVAAALHVDDLEDRSCSGAQTADLLGTQRTARGLLVPPQFSALSADTDLVTVGIGANNQRLYARIATVCRRTTKVCRLYDRREQLGAIVDQLRPELVATLVETKVRAPNARILLVSYPRMLPPLGDCRRLPRMRPEDRATFRSVNLRMRNEMRDAAEEAEVEFIDFYAMSFGHDVCSDEPWIQGRIGNNRRGAALHPLMAGQRAVARLIADHLREPPPPSP